MPVQINEVIIRAVVDTTAAAAAGENASPASQVNDAGAADIEIAALVLEIIKEKNQR